MMRKGQLGRECGKGDPVMGHSIKEIDIFEEMKPRKSGRR